MHWIWTQNQTTQSWDGVPYLLVDLEIECGKDDHPFFSLFVALPSLCVWGVGIPVVALLLMYKNYRKGKLHDIAVKKKYGFLFLGYKKRAYYWEIVILYRKMAIVFISVFLVSLEVTTQALVAFVVMMFAYIAHYKKRPFEPAELDDAEYRSIVCEAITLYCGMYFLSDDVKSSDRWKWFFFILIVLANLYFGIYWTIRFSNSILMHLKNMNLDGKLRKMWYLVTCRPYSERLKRPKITQKELRRLNLEKFMATDAKIFRLNVHYGDFNAEDLTRYLGIGLGQLYKIK